MWVVGFPKSGNTWVSFLLAYTLNAEYDDADDPGVHPVRADQRALVKGGLPHTSFQPLTGPVLKTHGLGPLAGSGPVVYVVRDGRDVMVSYYFYSNQYRRRRSGVRTKLAYILRTSGSGHTLRDVIGLRAGEWAHHVQTWKARSPDAFLRYEDLHADPMATLQKTLHALGASVDEEVVDRAVQLFSFERQAGRRPGNEDEGSFFRKGIVGDWRNHFSEEDHALFLAKAGSTLDSLGYL